MMKIRNTFDDNIIQLRLVTDYWEAVGSSGKEWDWEAVLQSHAQGSLFVPGKIEGIWST